MSAAAESKQPPRPVLFSGVGLIDPASRRDEIGVLLVVDGRIAATGGGLSKKGLPEATEHVAARGLCLAPGIVDLRVQLREPGEEHKETIASASTAAAAGGVTSMVALPNTDPVIDDVAGIEFIARRAREIRKVKVYVYAGVTKGLLGKDLTEFGLLSESGAVAFTDGLTAVADARVMRRALSYASAFGVLIVQHPEEPSLAAGGQMNEGELATRLGLAGIPAMAEVILIERDLRILALTGGRYHVAHVSTAAGIEAIRQAKERGLHVTCDTAPPYFALNELGVGEYRTFAKLSPALRSEADRAAVAAAVADGSIDCIASDHAPHDQDSKRVPFAQAAPGVIGLETLLPVSLELVHKRMLSMVELFQRLALTPADLLGLPQGRLSVGAPADLVLFDPERAWVIDEDRFLSKSKNSPFGGRPVQGRVLRPLVDGRTVFSAAT